MSLYVGDVRDGLRSFIAAGARAQTCVTSPPYWGLRDYGVAGQLGLEVTIAEYVANMVEVFRLVRDVLADDGTLWLNLGDSYATGAGKVGECPGGGEQGARWRGEGSKHDYGLGPMTQPNRLPQSGLKPKDLCGIPWRVAFALQTDGWWLRQDIIWAKPNPMPESITDRCTKSHEYLFLLAKSERYYYDGDAIAEPVTQSSIERLSQPNLDNQIGSDRVPGKTNGNMHAVVKRRGNTKRKDATERGCPESGVGGSIPWEGSTRNKRSVWTVTTQPYSDAHFAVMPTALVEPCIAAGSRVGDIVLDPFMGSGTVAQVAQDLGRQWIGCELNSAYAEMIRKRTAQQGMVYA